MGEKHHSKGQRTIKIQSTSAGALTRFSGLPTKQEFPILSRWLNSWKFLMEATQHCDLCMMSNSIPRPRDKTSNRHEDHLQAISNVAPEQAGMPWDGLSSPVFL